MPAPLPVSPEDLNMRLSTTWLTIALIAGATASCAPKAPPPPDEAAIRSAIEAANTKFTTAINKGDTATAFGVYADEVVLMMANEKPWRGRAEISKGFGGMMSAMTISEMTSKTESVMVSGDMAVETGSYAMTLTPKSGKNPKAMKDEGKYLTTWKKQADGSWKVVRDISNTNMPMQM